MADLPPPITHLGRYDIVRVLGQGAMGVVYEGRDPNLDRRVAIKTVRVVGMPAEEVLEYEQRFNTEARSAGRLQHPNIVSVYDSNKHEDNWGPTAYIVMEFVEGEDLKHFLDAGKRFTLEQTAFMITDLLAALDYAHRHKIIHRDIKPANMLLTKDGRIKLTDFGVARITDTGEATKTSGGTVGTLKYMSPEQVAGKAVDASSDLFSAGIVLYQLLTGVRPFDGEGYLDIVSKIVKEDPTPPCRLVGALPPALDSVVAKALAKSKLDRFADAAAFATALKAAVNNADLTITPSANPRPLLAEGIGTFPGSTSGSGSTITQELELVYWKDVKDSKELDVLEGFLRRFPTGIYAELAKRKLKTVAQAQKVTGTASHYESTHPRKLSEGSAASTSVGKVISGAVVIGSTVSDSTLPQHAAHTADDNEPTLPPNAYNDSEYGPSTQFAPTQFALSEPGTAENTSGVRKASARKQPMPLEADLMKQSSAAAPQKSSKLVIWASLGALTLGAIAFVSMLKPGAGTPPNTGLPTATVIVSPPVATPNASVPDASATLSVAATSADPITDSAPATVPAATASASATTATTTIASVAARAASASRVGWPFRRGSEPASSASSAASNPAAQPPTAAPTTQLELTATPAPTAPASRTPTALRNPRDACEGRVFLSLFVCVAEQCERPAFRSHPVCVERREMDERRRNAEINR